MELRVYFQVDGTEYTVGANLCHPPTREGDTHHASLGRQTRAAVTTATTGANYLHNSDADGASTGASSAYSTQRAQTTRKSPTNIIADRITKIKHEPASTAAAALGQWSLSRAQLEAIVDKCATERVPGAAHDCVQQAVRVLEHLRNGAHGRRTPRAPADGDAASHAEFSWDINEPDNHDIKTEPSVIGVRIGFIILG